MLRFVLILVGYTLKLAFVVYVDVVRLKDGWEKKMWWRRKIGLEWLTMGEETFNEWGYDYYVEWRKGYNKGKIRESDYGIGDKGNEVMWFCLEKYVMSNVY